MAISTAAAILGSTALSIGGSLLGGNSQKKAVDKATAAETANTDKNNALAREFRAENTANFMPYMESGNRARSAFDELLFGPSPPPTPSAFAAYGAPQQPSAFAPYGYAGSDFGGEDYGQFGMVPRRMGQPYGNMQYGAPVYAAQQPPGPVQAQPSARSAFDNYLNSTGYQFRFDEGMKGLNIGAGARGMLESGARDKAALRYGQGIASDEFARYMQLLDNQQRLGFNSASALAGVSQNTLGLITANNNNASSALANGALAKGSANANMWGGIAGSLGSAFGQLGSSYK